MAAATWERQVGDASPGGGWGGRQRRGVKTWRRRVAMMAFCCLLRQPSFQKKSERSFYSLFEGEEEQRVVRVRRGRSFCILCPHLANRSAALRPGGKPSRVQSPLHDCWHQGAWCERPRPLPSLPRWMSRLMESASSNMAAPFSYANKGHEGTATRKNVPPTRCTLHDRTIYVVFIREGCGVHIHLNLWLWKQPFCLQVHFLVNKSR